MMRYGITRLKCALEETPGGLESPVYLEALSARESSIRQAQATLAPYDAVMMTGPTNIMHFCGLPARDHHRQLPQPAWRTPWIDPLWRR